MGARLRHSSLHTLHRLRKAACAETLTREGCRILHCQSQAAAGTSKHLPQCVNQSMLSSCCC